MMNRDQKSIEVCRILQQVDETYFVFKFHFFCIKFNKRKNSVEIKDCFVILKLYKERYPEKYESIKKGFKELFI